MNDSSPAYSLGSSPAELQRLDAQSAFYEAGTRRFLIRAGLSRGMRVLDVGCGTGGLTLLAAELVGPTGMVVGIDASRDAIALASRRVAEQGLRNVRFMEANLPAVHIELRFDASIGRFILMHCADPVLVVKNLIENTRDRGIVAFLEPDYSGVRFSCPLPLGTQCLAWIHRALAKLGVDPLMGLKLYRTFLRAGLSKPGLCLEESFLVYPPPLLDYRRFP